MEKMILQHFQELNLELEYLLGMLQLLSLQLSFDQNFDKKAAYITVIIKFNFVVKKSILTKSVEILDICKIQHTLICKK